MVNLLTNFYILFLKNLSQWDTKANEKSHQFLKVQFDWSENFICKIELRYFITMKKQTNIHVYKLVKFNTPDIYRRL